MKRVTFSDFHRYKKNLSDEYARRSEIVKTHIDSIKNTSSTKIIKYPSYKESFDYVDSKFPGKGIKDVTIYLCSKSLLKRLGYDGLGGFFEKILKTVVIRKDDTVDETIVHELLHYVSDISVANRRTVAAEEEFAYINSIDYLRQKGRDDDYIINETFLPYMSTKVNNKKIIQEVLSTEEIKEFKTGNSISKNKIFKKHQEKLIKLMEQEAIFLGRDLINLHDRRNVINNKIVIEEDDFDLMEF